jgi:hypothetical protein
VSRPRRVVACDGGGTPQEARDRGFTKIAQYQALIAADVKADTRKLDTTENFIAAVTEDVAEPAGGPGGFGGFPGGGGGRGGGRGGPGGMSQRPSLSLKSFFEQRRAFLLNYPEIASLARAQ